MPVSNLMCKGVKCIRQAYSRESYELFSSKEEADSARVKLGKSGLNGTIVPT